MRMILTRLAGVAALMALLVPGLAQAQTPEAEAAFFKGKNVRLTVGYGPGGGYDVYARISASSSVPTSSSRTNPARAASRRSMRRRWRRLTAST